MTILVEDTRVGSQFLDQQDKVSACALEEKASVGVEDGGRRYKEQLDKIHCVMST